MLKHADIDKVFAALSDATRRGLLEQLSKGSASVSALAAPLDVTLAAVVQHLQVLEDAGLVKTEKVGRVRSCQLEPAGLRAAERWLADRRTAVELKLDRLEAFLDSQLSPPPRSKKGKKS